MPKYKSTDTGICRRKIRWHGSKEHTICDLCYYKSKRTLLSEEEFFVDGRTSYGHWALMCPACFEKAGIGLGTGVGQKYSGETFEKLEG